MYDLSLTGLAILLEKKGKILIGKRASNRDYGANWWEFPSGRMEKGELLIDALGREAKEELGIEIRNPSLIDAYSFIRGDTNLVLLTYYCKYKGEITKSDEHDELKWVSPEEAKLTLNFDRQAETVDKFTILHSCLK